MYFKMDFGEATFIRTHKLKQQLLVFHSVRRLGYVYKFMKNKNNQYVCCGCKKLGRSRTVTVVDGRVVGTKHPEDGHHDNCEPVRQSEIDVLDIDRQMRQSVHETGKRPFDAYGEAMSSIAKITKHLQLNRKSLYSFRLSTKFAASCLITELHNTFR